MPPPPFFSSTRIINFKKIQINIVEGILIQNNIVGILIET